MRGNGARGDLEVFKSVASLGATAHTGSTYSRVHVKSGNLGSFYYIWQSFRTLAYVL